MMIKALVLVTVLASLAQVPPGCDGGSSGIVVIGWVEAKQFDRGSGAHVIVINSVEYQVPGYFWVEVRIGDLVKYDGKTWTIVRRAGS